MAGIEKTIYILSIDLAKIDGTNFIPTALYYGENNISFGHKAIKKLEDYRIVNVNFKIELGNYDAGKKLSDHRIFETDDGTEKTAFEITKDFFSLILSGF